MYLLALVGTSEKSFVPVACPVLPGTIFYGIVPAPPPPSPAAVAAAAAASVTFIPADPGIDQLCAKLVSSVDDLTTETPGSVDYMRYTISVCVNQDPAKNRPKWTPSPLPAGMIFEGQSYYTIRRESRSVGNLAGKLDDRESIFRWYTDAVSIERDSVRRERGEYSRGHGFLFTVNAFF